MHRRPLLEMLQCYLQLFPAEVGVVDRVRQLVEQHADCFERTCRPGHITAAAWIVSPDRHRVLLTHHRKLGQWLQLGGHADGHWAVEEVALKEAQEESGMQHFDFVPLDGNLLPLDIDVHQIPARYDPSGALVEDDHEHHDIRFLLVAQPGESIRVSEESHDVRWFSSEEVLQITAEESIHRMLYKAAQLLGS